MSQIFKIRSLILVLMLTILLFGGCQKEGRYEQVENPYYDVQFELFEIFLTTDNKFLEVKHYFTDSRFEDTILDYSLIYRNTANRLEIIKKGSNRQMISKRVYNGTHLADNCKDSFYYNNQFYCNQSRTFKYNKDGYLINEKITSTCSASGVYEANYIMLNGNNISACYVSNVISHYYNGDAYDTLNFEFNNIENKIDIASFLGDCQGIKDINLRKKSSSGVLYNYELDQNGFVVKRIEFYNSSFSMPKHEHRIAFKYFF